MFFRMKKITALLLVLCLLTAAVPQAGAFSDITNPDIALAAASLQSLGIAQGTSDTTYSPNTPLTRAQFCTFAVRALGMEDSAPSYGYRMLFSDVKPGAWYTGYVNLAYSAGLVQGYGNGLFGPNDGVTYAQVVTIILRLLGYTSAEIGRVWPGDYVRFAQELDLSKGVTLQANDPITRGGAALLLYNAMRTIPRGSSGIYALSMPDVRSSVTAILLDNENQRANGEEKLMACVIGASASLEYFEQDTLAPDELLGCYGTLLLNAAGESIGFIPESREFEDCTIDSARASGIADDRGRVHRITGSASVICDGSVYPYSTTGYVHVNANEGKQARIFYNDNGSVLCVYIASGPAASDTEVIVAETHTTAGELERRLGLGSRNYSILKNGAPADSADLAQYDVAYYDAAAGTLCVSDRRITGYIEAASPSVDAATSVTIAGCTLKVLESAWDSLGDFGLGSHVTLLLTDDLQVAAAYPTRTVSADMIGILSADGRSVTLAGSGLTLSAKEIDAAEKLRGSLVSVTVSTNSRLTCASPKSDSFSGTLDTVKATLGSRELAPGCIIYEWTGTETNPSYVYSLEGTAGTYSRDFDALLWTKTLSSAYIDYCHINSAGQIDVLLLCDATGNCYEYGDLKLYTGSSGVNFGTATLPAFNDAVSITNSVSPAGSAKYLCAIPNVRAGYTGISLGGSGNGYARVSASARLYSAKISASDIFQNSDDDWFITLKGYEVPVSERVEVLIERTDGWMSGENGLLAAYSSSDSITVYYDRSFDTGAQIRLIVLGTD
ncbi:MAG: S-layer homology domain-containing protein [Eubacteriales bacterium]|nr:S-layer homology domain-containing protein [Eubacteriales bacterium]